MDNLQREALASRILSMINGEAEIIVACDQSSLTRFTRDLVHQNLAKDELSVSIRIILDGKTGVARTNRIDDQSLASCISQATDLAQLSQIDPHAVDLPDSTRAIAPERAFDPPTETTSPQDRADAVASIFAHAHAAKMWCAGYVSTTRHGITIMNTRGTQQSFDGTDAAVNTKFSAADSTGFAEAYSTSFAALNASAVGQRAVEIARSSAQPQSVNPGMWSVILEPAAFGELLSYIGDHFSAQAFDEGSSFFGRELGGPFFSSGFNLTDDYAHALAPSMPFDFEGYRKSRVDLVRGGRITDIVTDTYYARKLDRPNTGHGLPAPNANGPQALNLVVAPGKRTREELIASVDRGLLVTRFWYIRVVDRRRCIVTGMTRDGTFLIEHGKVKHGVKNMRFNVSIVDLLARVEAAREQHRTGGYGYSLVVPAVRIDDFAFTSGTDF